MYAIVRTGGKQYRVAPGDQLKVERISAERGEEIVLDQVLAIGDSDGIRLNSYPGRRAGQGERGEAGPGPQGYRLQEEAPQSVRQEAGTSPVVHAPAHPVHRPGNRVADDT